MKSITIKGSQRKRGQKGNETLRNAGMVPCVVYGGMSQSALQQKKLHLKTWFTRTYTPL